MALTIHGEVVTLELCIDTLRWRGLPQYMAEGLYYYLAHHIRPGSFLESILSNNLIAAAATADKCNSRLLFEWTQLMYNDLPSDCCGSRENVTAWLSKREI